MPPPGVLIPTPMGSPAQLRAVARRRQGKPGISAVDWHYGWGYRGMGGVVTTVHDMLAWDRGAEWKTGLGWAVAATKTHVALQLLD